jgi:hypothetical protein
VQQWKGALDPEREKNQPYTRAGCDKTFTWANQLGE